MTDSPRSAAARVALGAGLFASGIAAVLTRVHGWGLVAAWAAVAVGVVGLLVIAFPPVWITDPYQRWVIGHARYQQRFRCPNRHEFDLDVKTVRGNSWVPTDSSHDPDRCPLCGLIGNVQNAGMHSPNRIARWAVRRGYIGDQVTETRDR